MSGHSSIARPSVHAFLARNTKAASLSSAMLERYASQNFCSWSGLLPRLCGRAIFWCDFTWGVKKRNLHGRLAAACVIDLQPTIELINKAIDQELLSLS